MKIMSLFYSCLLEYCQHFFIVLYPYYTSLKWKYSLDINKGDNNDNGWRGCEMELKIE